MGAWIEISANSTITKPLNLVAPFMGAWIEISVYQKATQEFDVAPFMGAWIEI